MRKLKVYLDTSVISYLDQQDATDKMAETHLLWEQLPGLASEVVVSDITIDELEDCPEPKLRYLRTQLHKIAYVDVDKTEEAERLSELYFSVGGLPPKSRVDAMHIAIATVCGCNVIVSWNFKHIVNLRAMTAVDAVNAREGYAPLRILSPTMLLEGAD